MSLNYVMIGSNDVIKARVFYDALLPVIGGRLVADDMPHAVCYALPGGGRMWIATPFDQATATPGNGTMVGLRCSSTDVVQAAHDIALAQGGQDEGAPARARNMARISMAPMSGIWTATR